MRNKVDCCHSKNPPKLEQWRQTLIYVTVRSLLPLPSLMMNVPCRKAKGIDPECSLALLAKDKTPAVSPAWSQLDKAEHRLVPSSKQPTWLGTAIAFGEKPSFGAALEQQKRQESIRCERSVSVHPQTPSCCAPWPGLVTGDGNRWVVS